MATTGGNGPEQAWTRRLSPRERDVLRLIAEGMHSSQIAERLQLSVAAVATHRRNIRRKLGLGTIAELTRLAIREGLVEP